ncbi:PhzF family phenazine biosynthesis protein [Sesbania bispinosa]|nr:PhzF family phenazine biosynthesis protein [Sesbania bispinosa]
MRPREAVCHNGVQAGGKPQKNLFSFIVSWHFLALCDLRLRCGHLRHTRQRPREAQHGARMMGAKPLGWGSDSGAAGGMCDGTVTVGVVATVTTHYTIQNGSLLWLSRR